MSLSQAQGFIGAGDVLLAKILPNGTLGKRRDMGNVTKLAIKSNAEVKEQVSRKRATAGQVLETTALQQPAELSATFETINRESFMYCFMGEEGAYSQAEATVENADVTMQIDGWVSLGKEDLGETVVLTNSDGTTTYAEGTHYEVNRRLGLVRALEGGPITDGQACKIDYTAKAFAGVLIRGNVQPQIRAELWLDGVNQVDNSLVIVKAWEVVLSPASEFDFFKDDWNTIELTGKLKTPPGKSEPFTVYQR